MKSIFTKLSTLLFCGVVAMVGCTDFSEDIQAVDVKVDGLTTELNNYKTSTAATIAELQSAIAALEATQKQMADDYAKKSDLEAAKSELQDKLNTLNSNIEKAAADAAAAIAALDAAKADKSEVVALKETVETAIAEANAAIAALDAAKADKTQVDQIAGDVATLIEGYQQMIAQFQNLSLIVDGKAEQADLELVQADVNSLKQGYMETVSALQNLAGRMEAAEGAIELAEGDIADLKKAAAEAVFAITNLNAQVEALDARVEALEGEMKKVQSEIALHTQTLQNLAGRLEAAEGAIEDEAAAREKADKALQEAVSLLNMGLTNLQMAYDIHVAEFEAYQDIMAKKIEALELQDALIYKTIQDNFLTLSISIEETAAALRAEQAEAIAALEKKIVEAWEKERALIYNTIEDIKNTLFAAIEEGDAAVIETMELADALIYKTIESYVGILEIAMLEGDAAVVEAMEAADALLYKTILDIQNTLMIAVEEGDAAVLATVAAQLEEELALVYNTIEDIKNTLFIAIEEGDAAVAEAAQAALDDAVALLYKTIDNTRENLQAEIAELNNNLTAMVDDAVALLYKTITSTKADLQAEIQDLRNELDTILGRLTADVSALLERVQSLVYVPDYSDHKATIDWAMIATTNVMPAAAENDAPAYSIVAKATDLKYLVKANAGEDAVTVAAEIAANPSVLDYIVTDVKTRGASQTGADLEIVNVKAEGEYIIVSVVAKKFDAKFFDNKRQGIYSAALALVDANGNNLTSEYTNLVPGEAAHIEMGLYLTEADDVMNVAGKEDTTKMPFNDYETVYTSLCPTIGFVIDDEKAMANLTSVQPYLTVEDLKALGYDMNVTYRFKADNAWSGNVGSTFAQNNTVDKYFKLGNDKEANITVSVVEGTPASAKGESVFAKYIATANGTTVTYTHYFVLSNAQVNVVFDKVIIPWSFKLADELRGVNKAGEDVPYINTYIKKAVNHNCQYNLGTMLKSISAAGELEKTIKVNDVVVSDDRVVIENYDDAEQLADIKFTKGSPKFSAEGPTEYEIVYSGTYNEQYDVTATAIVVFEQIPSFEITSDVTLASQKGWFVGDDPLVKDGILDKNLAADLGYETAADALNQLYAAYTDAASTKETEITFGGKTIKGSRGNGNVQLNVTENHDLTKVYLYNGDVEELLGKAQLEDDSVFAIKHTITTWTGAKVVYTINAKTDLPDYVLSTDPVRVKNDIVEVKGEIVNEEYTVDVADLAKYYYIFNEGLETLEAPKTNVPELEVEFTLAGQNKAEGFYIKDDIYNFPVKFENKGLLDMNTAVVNWGTYPYTEIVVNATLKANGYPIDSKPITLVTKDPLHILFEDVDVTVDHKAGTNDEPVVAKVYHNFNITSDVEPEAGNLCNIDAKTIAGLFWYSHADKTYGIEVETEVLQVYYEDNGVRKNWDREKYTIGYRVDEKGEYILDKNGEKIFDGNIYINADDAGILVPIKAEVGVRVSHRIHAASPVCVNEGTITVTFNPAK